jgi:(p)ppGpp synthase/HD superfamily hydrolase
VRKGTDIPYITHPFSVALILSQAGCSEEVIVAGLLHDTIEDTSITLDDIRETFGDRIALIVMGCSEPDKSLPWEKRKEHTIAFLKTAPLEVRLVVCADKLHNVRTITSEYRKIGDQVWDPFKRGREKQKWYYRSLMECFFNQSDIPKNMPLFEHFKEEVENLFGE